MAAMLKLKNFLLSYLSHDLDEKMWDMGREAWWEQHTLPWVILELSVHLLFCIVFFPLILDTIKG